MSSATPAPAPTKGTKIKRALKSAARLPRVPGIRAGRGSGRNSFTPRAGEPPVVILRLQVLGCTDVLAKDRGGTSDPFVVASLLNNRHQTPVAKRTVNPVYAAKDATFDFPIYLSLADRLGVVELVIWDKDMLKKEYLGEVALPLEDWFNDREFPFDHPGNKPFSLNIISTRAGTPTTGRIHIKLGFAPTSANNLMEYDEIYGELVKRTRPSLVSAPPTEGVGTIRSNPNTGPADQLQDDGGLSSESDDSDDDDAEFVDASDATPPTSAGARAPSRSPKPLLDLYIPPDVDAAADGPTTMDSARSASAPSAVSTSSASAASAPGGMHPRPPFALPELHILPSSPATPTPGASLPTATPMLGEDTPRPSAGFSLPSASGGGGGGGGSRFIPRNGSDGGAATPSGSGAGSGSGMGMGAPSAGIAMIGRRRKSDYEFKGANDIVGIVMLEIQSADDLPRLANMTRTGWDMDPFVVISFGKKVFRTRVVRHSRSPVWDEKLLFHVRRYETAFRIQLTVLDWDKLSSNDHVGDASLEVSELVAGAPQPDPV
ncbi:C2 domain-containing protein, partial [Pholiota molesta]